MSEFNTWLFLSTFTMPSKFWVGHLGMFTKNDRNMNCSRLVGASLPDSIWSPIIVLDVPCVPIQVVEGWRPRSVWIWCQRKVDIFLGVLCPTQGNCSLRSRSFSIPILLMWADQLMATCYPNTSRILMLIIWCEGFHWKFAMYLYLVSCLLT